MSYEYDVFISYKRKRFATSWIVDYFIPYLQEYLENFSASYCGKSSIRLFFDQTEVNSEARQGLQVTSGIEPGAVWRTALTDSIAKSRCMVALYTPPYFQSDWCQSEHGAFEERAAMTGKDVIIPVSIFSKRHLPARAHERQMYCLDDYVIDGEALRNSVLFPKFCAEMKLIADKVARAVCDAPAFGEWPKPNPPGQLSPPPSPPVARF